MNAQSYKMSMRVALLKRALSLTVTLFSLGVFGSIASAQSDVLPHPGTREALKQCGTLSYDPQGGSLVINRQIEVLFDDAALERSLISEATNAPFQACLRGDWLNLPRGRVFNAVSIEN